MQWLAQQRANEARRIFKSRHLFLRRMRHVPNPFALLPCECLWGESQPLLSIQLDQTIYTSVQTITIKLIATVHRQCEYHILLTLWTHDKNRDIGSRNVRIKRKKGVVRMIWLVTLMHSHVETWRTVNTSSFWSGHILYTYVTAISPLWPSGLKVWFAIVWWI